MHVERFARPGGVLVGSDSHTTTSGALAMVAIGAGGLDVAVVMGGHPFAIACPEVIEVWLEGELARPWVQAKDVILELLRRLSASGGKNRIFEFTGPGAADLSVPERGTIANMIAELGRERDEVVLAALARKPAARLLIGAEHRGGGGARGDG